MSSGSAHDELELHFPVGRIPAARRADQLAVDLFQAKASHWALALGALTPADAAQLKITFILWLEEPEADLLIDDPPALYKEAAAFIRSLNAVESILSLVTNHGAGNRSSIATKVQFICGFVTSNVIGVVACDLSPDTGRGPLRPATHSHKAEDE